MSGPELALGVVSAVDVAIKACKTVVKTCSSFKHAETEIQERSTRLLSNCLQIGTQLEILHHIGDQLDEQRQNVQIDVLKILILKVNHADTKLRSLAKSQPANSDHKHSEGYSLSKRQKANYALQKSCLDTTIDEVESWQRLSVNPLWFATMKFQNQHFDKELHQATTGYQNHEHELIRATIAVRNPLRDFDSSAVFLRPEKLDSAEAVEVTFSSVQSVKIDEKWRLVDSISDLPKDAVLHATIWKKNVFSIIFRIPERMSEPETLRAKMMASDTTHSLSERFRLATQLARAVFSVHMFDMVHESIRPENVILFRDPDSALGSAFLLGFDKARWEEDRTRLVGDSDWTKNLYRHPQRQGSRLQDRYIMQHDIYSLGVCMLEIGLWYSFVTYGPGQTSTRSQTYDLGAESSSQIGRPEHVKSRLLSLATKELPGKMGTKYARIVESCLTCLDLGNDDFGEESEAPEDGVNIAVRYIEKVLMQLSDISV